MSLFGTRAATHLPGFDGATGWLNSEPLTAEGLRGKVVLVDFWTYTCINWLRTFGYVRAWAEKYAGQGLIVMGVHTPEFAFEHDVDNVTEAAKDLAVELPIALDNDYAVWNAFSNRYWPAVYIADGEGRIRHHQFGEGGYEECERVIQQLLREAGREDVGDELVTVADEGLEAQADWANVETPETYVGYRQAQNYVEGDPDRLELNQWALSGDWTIDPGEAVLNEAGGTIRFRFHARDVNLVLRSGEGTAVPFRVRLDGEQPGEAHGLDLDEEGNGALVQPRMYQLIRHPRPITDRTFEITFDGAGVEAYSFTFG